MHFGMVYVYFTIVLIYCRALKHQGYKMAGNELIDGIVKLIQNIIDIFLTIFYSILKPTLNNPSNFGSEPSAYLGNFAIGIFILISFILIIFIIYYGVWWLLSNAFDKENIFKQSIGLSITIEITYLLVTGFNNFTFVKSLGDIIGLSVIFVIIIFILERI